MQSVSVSVVVLQNASNRAPYSIPHTPEIIGTMVMRENTSSAEEHRGGGVVVQCWCAEEQVPRGLGLPIPVVGMAIGYRGQTQMEG